MGHVSRWGVIHVSILGICSDGACVNMGACVQVGHECRWGMNPDGACVKMGACVQVGHVSRWDMSAGGACVQNA